MTKGRSLMITKDQVKALEFIGFIWDSHAVNWEECLKQLPEDSTLFQRSEEMPQASLLALWVQF